ncbi:hypothetical protein DM02DRAFT_675027 [Periconia macrospinosa]|uniref:Uncharacterized protein n=1 Tax=Periconia macrospinosa TaxID=97972 RepID=A0A2V1DD83_9PLEO|nr:hypothetical protein DM02DRAFT_675027 [Periconia macrospinosa]
MPSYSSLNSKISNAPLWQYRKWILRILWVLQTLLVILRIVSMIFVLIVLLVLLLLEPGFSVIVGLVLGIDLILSFYTVFILWKQFTNKKYNPGKALQREALKSIFATYLWLSPVIHNPGEFLTPPKETSGTTTNQEEVQKTIAQIKLWMLIVGISVAVSFYSALWLVYMEWKEDKKGKESDGDIELQDEPEYQIRLVDRMSIDEDEGSSGDFIDEDEASHGQKRKF